MTDQTELERLRARATGGTPGCDVCGFADVEVPDSRFRLEPAADAEGRADSREGLDVVVAICPQCSAVQLYSSSHL